MPKKYILRIDSVWTEYNKMWPAIKALRDQLQNDKTFEPQKVSITAVDTDKGYEITPVTFETILRGVSWANADVPDEWTGAINAVIIVNPHVGIVDKPVTFSSVSSIVGHHITMYEWSYDGGKTYTAGAASDVHIFDTYGFYKVMLRITDDAGDTDVSKMLNYQVMDASPPLP